MSWVILPFESASGSIDTGVMTLGEGDAEERKRLKGVFISLFPIWPKLLVPVNQPSFLITHPPFPVNHPPLT